MANECYCNYDYILQVMQEANVVRYECNRNYRHISYLRNVVLYMTDLLDWFYMGIGSEFLTIWWSPLQFIFVLPIHLLIWLSSAYCMLLPYFKTTKFLLKILCKSDCLLPLFLVILLLWKVKMALSVADIELFCHNFWLHFFNTVLYWIRKYKATHIFISMLQAISIFEQAEFLCCVLVPWLMKK